MKSTGTQPWNQITGREPTGEVSDYIRGRNGKDSLNGMPNYARVTVFGRVRRHRFSLLPP